MEELLLLALLLQEENVDKGLPPVLLK